MSAKKPIEQNVKTQKKINSESPSSVLKQKEASQLKSAQKASVENHNGETHVFSHARSNRGK